MIRLSDFIKNKTSKYGVLTRDEFWTWRAENLRVKKCKN